MVFKMISTIYERLVKAKNLIADKVQLDFDKDAEVKELIKDHSPDSVAELHKSMSEERYRIFISAVIGTLSQTPHKKLDSANYEDLTRMLIGSQAYLLFVFDKLVMQTLRDLPKLKTQDDCQKSIKLFTQFCREQSPK